MKRNSACKRFLSVVLMVVMLSTVLSVPVSALRPGDPMGWVLYTDIVAYIDGYPVRSYNINGYTYVVVEDLVEYGFNVTWKPDEQKLVVGERTGKVTSDYKPEKNTHRPGDRAMQYLYTKITTWLKDTQVTGYNIGGYTCICMDDLAKHYASEYVWDAAGRALRMTISGKIPVTPTKKVLTSEEIYKQCAPAVFYIEVYDRNEECIGSGSGFFIHESGIAVTNYHVIDGAYSALIQTSDEEIYKVIEIYDYDVENDWAILQIDGEGFSVLPLGASSTVVGGSPVYAIGSPMGLQNTISEGIISNPKRVDGGVTYIQTSAPISRGSSGGALINKYGEVIGITAAIYTNGANLSLAIPISAIDGYSKDSSSTFASLYKETKPAGENGGNSQEKAFEALRQYICDNASVVSGECYMWKHTSGNITLALTYYSEYDQISVICDLAASGDDKIVGNLMLSRDSFHYATVVEVWEKGDSDKKKYAASAIIYSPDFNDNYEMSYYEMGGSAFDGIKMGSDAADKLVDSFDALYKKVIESSLEMLEITLKSLNVSVADFGFENYECNN